MWKSGPTSITQALFQRQRVENFMVAKWPDKPFQPSHQPWRGQALGSLRGHRNSQEKMMDWQRRQMGRETSIWIPASYFNSQGFTGHYFSGGCAMEWPWEPIWFINYLFFSVGNWNRLVGCAKWWCVIIQGVGNHTPVVWLIRQYQAYVLFIVKGEYNWEKHPQ